MEQTVPFSGVGSRHQNVIAEVTIKTITSCAQTMMLHALLHWPETADLELWPFAIDYAVHLWNHLPKQDGRLSPKEYITGTIAPNHNHLLRLHTFMSPCYVLDPKLQDAGKVPNWNKRAR